MCNFFLSLLNSRCHPLSVVLLFSIFLPIAHASPPVSASPVLTIRGIYVTEDPTTTDIAVFLDVTITNQPSNASHVHLYFVTNATWPQGEKDFTASGEYRLKGYIWKGHQDKIGKNSGKDIGTVVKIEFQDVNHQSVGPILTSAFTLDQVALSVPYPAAGNLDNAYCYPSPARVSLGDSISFANFTDHAIVTIISPTGYVVNTFNADANGYILPWDGKDSVGERLGTGTYIVHVRDPHGNRKIFNILVIQ